MAWVVSEGLRLPVGYRRIPISPVQGACESTNRIRHAAFDGGFGRTRQTVIKADPAGAEAALATWGV